MEENVFIPMELACSLSLVLGNIHGAAYMLQLEYLPVNKNIFLRIHSQIRLRSLPTLIPRFNK